MKSTTILLTLSTLFAAVVVCFAADVNLGTWKLNGAKSKPAPETGNLTVVIASAGDSVKVSRDGIDPNGKPFHDEWMGRFDGKDYPLSGSPDVDTRAYKQVNDHTWAITEKKGGKIVETGRIVYSADGKTRTLTAAGTDAKGVKISATTVYDKQ